MSRQPRSARTIPHPNSPTIEVYTIRQVARKVGYDRSTLIRYEQQGKISKAKWVGPPINGRVYTPEDVTKLLHELARIPRGADRSAGREIIDTPVRIAPGR